jgi:hypothetical protein
MVVCSGELWVERLTNDDGFEGCQAAPTPCFLDGCFWRKVAAQDAVCCGAYVA